MTDPEERNEEWVKKHFPDAGDAPSNEVVVDPNAEEAPNTDHPK